MTRTLNAALIGAGIFPREVYARLFRENAAHVIVKWVWSRTPSTAKEYVDKFLANTVSSTATPAHGEAGLEEILRDHLCPVVIVVLPVQVALTVVERCLAAGKHVIQEKPVGPNVRTTLPVLRHYRARHMQQQSILAEAGGEAALPYPKAGIWMFAENYRYEGVFLEAARRVPQLGTIIKLDLVADLPMDARNRYHASAWRRDTALCPGGFFMDSSVHFVAALRLLADACRAGEAVAACALGTHVKPDLSNPGSVVGLVKFSSGIPASISISLEAHHVRWSLVVVGTAGSLEVSRGGWTGSRSEYLLSMTAAAPSNAAPAPSSHPLSSSSSSPAANAAPPNSLAPTPATPNALPSPAPGNAAGAGVQQSRFGFSGLETEFRDFLRLALESEDRGAGHPPPRPSAASSPEQGLRDLAIIEALLASIARGGQMVPVEQV